MFSQFEQPRKLRLPKESFASFSKDKTMISKRTFKAKFMQLPQRREEVVFKIYELRIFGSSIEHRYEDASSY